MNTQEWSKEYTEVSDTRPEDGTILKTIDGSPAKLTVEISEDKPPFIYGRIFVPEIMSVPVGWYLHTADMETYRGWKCILMPRARKDLIKKIGLDGDHVFVQSLRVIKPSQSGQSLLCEVNKYVSDSSVQVSNEGSDQVDPSGDDGGSGGEA